MHPYLAEQMAAAHMADLHREAAATCCASHVRRPLRERLAGPRHRVHGQACC